MTAGTVLLIAIPVLVVLAIVAFVTTSRRRDGQIVSDLSRETKRADRSESDVVDAADVEAEAKERYSETTPVEESAPAAAPAPRDPEEVGFTRRSLLNRGILASFTVAMSGFATASLAFCWPGAATGFGAKIAAGKLGDILDYIKANKAPYYVPEARSWVAPYPEEALGKAKGVYDDRLFDGYEAGIVALFQTCPHLGCRVPWCPSSQWFECPCHGSKYNRVGEKRGGPAPRGMDRFPVEIAGEKVSIDTGQRIPGPAIGVNTTGQEPEGPHCV
ncbi:MAG: ubiquinol-cytochrome c reductase iron-sulfur subunit [Actinobacteria bacterium]|nr:ubiquinol-cytochrome c reductase iron-sulfur subunit [Actinomycetota bacterium]